MDGSEKFMIFLLHIISNHHHPKIDVLPKPYLQIILAAKWLKCDIQVYVPETAATTFAFRSVFILLLWI